MTDRIPDTDPAPAPTPCGYLQDPADTPCERAAGRFGGDDGVFNAAGFGLAFNGLAGVKGGLDGLVVRAMLTGRSDVTVLKGGHYQLRKAGAR